MIIDHHRLQSLVLFLTNEVDLSQIRPRFQFHETIRVQRLAVFVFVAAYWWTRIRIAGFESQTPQVVGGALATPTEHLQLQPTHLDVGQLFELGASGNEI